MAQIVTFKKAQLAILHKLSIKVTDKGQDYHYIPIWFQKIDALTYKIMTFNELPPEVLKQLNDRKEKFLISDIIAANEHPAKAEDLKSHIILPFKK